MTKEQQRIAIAEACGWKILNDKTYFIGFPPWDKTSCGQPEFLPHYLNDLNAMHEAEKTLNRIQSEKYAEFLLDILEIPTPFIGTARCAFLTGHATAAQRAEAFLKTLNLWKE